MWSFRGSRMRGLRTTSHTRPKACHHCILRSLIGWEKVEITWAWVHTRRWRSKGPNRLIVDKNPTWILTWQNMDNVSWFAWICSMSTSKNRHDANIWQAMSKSMDMDSLYNLWRRVEGPHNYIIIALGLCAKWPLIYRHLHNLYMLHGSYIYAFDAISYTLSCVKKKVTIYSY